MKLNNMLRNSLFFIFYFLFSSVGAQFIQAASVERKKLNFNADWRLSVGDFPKAVEADFDDSQWQQVTLPYAFNGDEAFRKDIVDLTDTIVWYRKTFEVESLKLKVSKFFIEFEGVRQGADFYLNGHHLGFSENGVMACGFDLTPYLKDGKNVLAVRCDNSWTYRSRQHDSRYQWNDRNFNANYGGIPKNVFLHVADRLYQTLPLYSNLGTTGTYIYATDFDIAGKKAVIHAESQVKNEDTVARTFTFCAQVLDADGREVAQFHSERITMQPGETRIVKAQQQVKGLHFWSWGYGFLYTVKTSLADGETVDCVTTRTGFRKTRFGEGKIWLNDRVLMVHGYAQRTSNEWPGVGLSVPAWLSDYSNGLMVESGGNLVRWMHVTPWKQDIESCDRVGLIQAMPAGDAEKDVEGPRWTQRTELMRDAIIYNRNNPSILFYECGNESISREHMLAMKAIRDEYDPHGGRAIGSREMLDIDEAEYGGEMLYINKSKKHPMWAMEYCRDEGLRKYWDEWSYPYHKEGDGPLYRGKPATDYNHNMDQFAVEMVRRWYDYWRERPGTGTRVSSGGVKIVFSDTNTHHRGESNYRMSGVTDAMRIPKDAFFAHQVMWSGWVEPEEAKTYIVGHWNYETSNIKKTVYVVSTGDEVELFLNGKSLGKGRQSYRYLFTFDDVPFEPGKLEAVANDGSRYQLETVGDPYQLKLTAIENPEGTKADGADMVLFQVEVLDKQGRRCPLDDRIIHFELWGEGKWIGGIGTRNNKDMQRPDDNRPAGLLDAAVTKNVSDNYVGAMNLPVECGVNRVLVRTTPNAGDINVSAYAEGVKPAYIKVESGKIKGESCLPQMTLKGCLTRGETPLSPSYTEQAQGVKIVSAKAGFDSQHASRSFDDNELSEWKNDGRLATAWITYKLERKAVVDDICLKLTGWRLRSYPLEIFAGKTLIWSGETERSLGYVHLTPNQCIATDEITIRLKGAGKDKDAFGGIVEVAEPAAGELDLFKAKNGGETKNELRIVEIEFIEKGVEVVLNKAARQPFTYNMAVPDGNYRVTVTLGNQKQAGQTVVRAESRRHFSDMIATKKGQEETVSFVVNKHSPRIDQHSNVKLKPREWTYKNWDDSLNISFCGPAPAVKSIRIEPDTEATTVFLCGNSTVVDQEDEPWASWGQMITRWFDNQVVIANYAESGLSCTSFLAQQRLDKILTLLRKGDYVIVEFGHNDEKEKKAGDGAWYSYSRNLKTFVDRVRERGGNIIFCTPTARRFFNDDHKTIKNTHGDYPEAMKTVARREGVPVIDLTAMSTTLYETLGEEGSKQTLVHYPANTFAGQDKPLADNTHFNPFGAWQIAKMVVMGLKQMKSPLADHLRSDWQDYDPAHPDDPTQFVWYMSGSGNILKPDGN